MKATFYPGVRGNKQTLDPSLLDFFSQGDIFTNDAAQYINPRFTLKKNNKLNKFDIIDNFQADGLTMRNRFFKENYIKGEYTYHNLINLIVNKLHRVFFHSNGKDLDHITFQNLMQITKLSKSTIYKLLKHTYIQTHFGIIELYLLFRRKQDVKNSFRIKKHIIENRHRYSNYKDVYTDLKYRFKGSELKYDTVRVWCNNLTKAKLIKCLKPVRVKNPTHKKCNHCRQVKNVSEYHKNSKAYDGLACFCKQCRREIEMKRICRRFD